MGSPEPLRYLRQDVQKLAEAVEKLAGDNEKDIRGIEAIRVEVDSFSVDANRLSDVEFKSDMLLKLVTLVKDMVDLNHNILLRVDKRVAQHEEVLKKIVEFCQLSVDESKIVAEYIGISDDETRLDNIERRINEIETSTTQ